MFGSKLRRRSLVLAALLVILNTIVLSGGGTSPALAGKANGNGNGKPQPTPSPTPTPTPTPSPTPTPAVGFPSCGGGLATYSSGHTCGFSYAGGTLSVAGAFAIAPIHVNLFAPGGPDPYAAVEVSLFGPDGRLLVSCMDGGDGSSQATCTSSVSVALDLGAPLTCSAQVWSSYTGAGEYACSSL